MGIDIYMNWDKQTEDEKQAQYTGLSGNVGYLREAYHGSPYVTQFLVKEAFDSEEGEAHIPCAVLRERLPEAIQLHIQRQKNIYQEDVNWESPSSESFIAFVELAERLEAKGKNPTIIASY